MMDARLSYLLSGLVEDSLTDLEGDELSQLLENSAEVRADYVLFMATHAELTRQTSAELDHGVVLQFSDEAEGGRRGRRRWLPLAAMAAAAIIALAGVVLFAPKDDAAPADPVVEAPPAVIQPVVTVGRLTESSAGTLVAAVDERRVLRAEGIRPGTYRLFDGLVELTLKNGVELTLEGPATFHFESAANMRLDHGKMAASVPPSGHGFRVELPDAVVVDLGTKFGIEVQADGTSEVHVFQGLVEVKPKNGDAAYLLRGKEASRFGLERQHARIDLDPNRFVRQLREPESEYARLVLSYRPVIYLPMVPSRDGETLYDMSGNELHGKVHRVSDFSHLWSYGRIGSGLRFDGTTFRGYAAVWNYPRTDGNKISGVAWVRAESHNEWASIMKNWVGPLHGQFHFGLYEKTGQLEVHVDDGGTEIFAIDPEPLPLNQWHHVAFVADGDMLRLYRNGTEVAKSAYQSILNREDVRHLVIGNKADPQFENREDPIQLWHGRLDELALFYHALDAASIRELYESGMRWDYQEEKQIGTE